MHMVRRNFYILSILLFSLAVLASACVPAPTPQPSPTLPSNGDSSTATPSGDVLPWLQVFFTKPNPPDDQAHGIDNYVVPAYRWR